MIFPLGNFKNDLAKHVPPFKPSMRFDRFVEAVAGSNGNNGLGLIQYSIQMVEFPFPGNRVVCFDFNVPPYFGNGLDSIWIGKPAARAQCV